MKSQLPSNTFCILPWVHFFHEPNGNVHACCAAKLGTGGFGNIKDFNSINEIVNTDAMKRLRTDMLAGRQNLACSQCYQEEDNGLVSFRKHKNEEIGNVDLPQLLNNTAEDGSLSEFKMQYWDSRFSNICNYKCRMCGPEYSHSWAEEAYRGTGRKDFVVTAHQDEFSLAIKKYGDLSALQEVYFAGGEALFQQEHWQMLDHLDQLGLHNLRITYTTNLSRLSFGKYNLEEYLKRFTNVLFIVSLDACGPLLEYIRSGANWSTTQQNVKTVSAYSNAKIKFNVVITIYNILHLTDVIEYAVANSSANEEVDLTVAHGPADQNITNLPAELKLLARTRLQSSKHYELLKDKIDAVINYMEKLPTSTWRRVVTETNRVDAVRNESVIDVVPEFKQYWSYNEKI